MKIAIIEKEKKSNFLNLIYANDDSLNMLTSFLTDAIGINPTDYFFNWLKGLYKQNWAYGNIYGLEEYQNKIFVCDQFDEEEERYKYFNTTRVKMLEIIENWVAVVSKDPTPEMIIICQDDRDNIKIIDAADMFK